MSKSSSPPPTTTPPSSHSSQQYQFTQVYQIIHFHDRTKFGLNRGKSTKTWTTVETTHEWLDQSQADSIINSHGLTLVDPRDAMKILGVRRQGIVKNYLKELSSGPTTAPDISTSGGGGGGGGGGSATARDDVPELVGLWEIESLYVGERVKHPSIKGETRSPDTFWMIVKRDMRIPVAVSSSTPPEATDTDSAASQRYQQQNEQSKQQSQKQQQQGTQDHQRQQQPPKKGILVEKSPYRLDQVEAKMENIQRQFIAQQAAAVATQAQKMHAVTPPYGAQNSLQQPLPQIRMLNAAQPSTAAAAAGMYVGGSQYPRHHQQLQQMQQFRQLQQPGGYYSQYPLYGGNSMMAPVGSYPLPHAPVPPTVSRRHILADEDVMLCMETSMNTSGNTGSKSRRNSVSSSHSNSNPGNKKKYDDNDNDGVLRNNTFPKSSAKSSSMHRTPSINNISSMYSGADKNRSMGLNLDQLYTNMNIEARTTTTSLPNPPVLFSNPDDHTIDARRSNSNSGMNLLSSAATLNLYPHSQNGYMPGYENVLQPQQQFRQQQFQQPQQFYMNENGRMSSTSLASGIMPPPQSATPGPRLEQPQPMLPRLPLLHTSPQDSFEQQLFTDPWGRVEPVAKQPHHQHQHQHQQRGSVAWEADVPNCSSDEYYYSARQYYQQEQRMPRPSSRAHDMHHLTSLSSSTSPLSSASSHSPTSSCSSTGSDLSSKSTSGIRAPSCSASKATIKQGRGSQGPVTRRASFVQSSSRPSSRNSAMLMFDIVQDSDEDYYYDNKKRSLASLVTGSGGHGNNVGFCDAGDAGMMEQFGKGIDREVTKTPFYPRF